MIGSVFLHQAPLISVWHSVGMAGAFLKGQKQPSFLKGQAALPSLPLPYLTTAAGVSGSKST